MFLALGINIEGQKELLGMWLAENEGAKFWLNVLTELKNRGLNDILIACVDGLKGFPDAINAYSALFDHGLASKSDQRFASIRSTGNLTFSTAF